MRNKVIVFIESIFIHCLMYGFIAMVLMSYGIGQVVIKVRSMYGK